MARRRSSKCDKEAEKTLIVWFKMKNNKIVQELFEVHTRHIPRQTIHLGDAENWRDIMNVKNKINAKLYMLSKCCTDGTPTLQLRNSRKIRRIRLGNFSKNELDEIIRKLDKSGLKYCETRYLALNPDFSRTKRCIFQERFSFFYNFLMKVRESFNRIRY